MKLSISSNAEAVLRQVQQMPDAMKDRIARAFDKENQATIGHIQQTYLSGPRPQRLGVRTNRLRSSLNASKASVNGNAVESIIGTNVAYAGVYERGFDGEVPVREHKRKIFRTHSAKGGLVFDMKTGRIQRKAARKIQLLQGEATVRAHKRHMVVRQRAFLAPGIKDSEFAYSQAVSNAIVAAWGGAS